jgi:hypothetical protein
LAGPSTVRATLVDLVISTVSPSTMPCTANRLPSVTISEGTAVLTTRMPFTSPTITPNDSAAATPAQIGRP